MKILLISPLAPPVGGIATWTKLYLNSSITKDHDIDLVNTSVIGSRINNSVESNLKDEFRRAFNICKMVKNKVKMNQYDIVHLNSSCSKLGIIRDLICVKLIKLKKIKLILHCHCDTKYMVKGKFSNLIFRRLVNNADKIFVLNNSSKEHVDSLTNNVSIIIPNFFDYNEFTNINCKKVSKTISKIIYVGHIVESKGCREILEVAQKMQHIDFYLIGRVSKEIGSLNCSKNVKFLGEISKENVIKHMMKSDILLFPTYTEGFPNVVLEAMICGLPIISTKVGAIPDMIEDKGGILVKVGSINDIVDSIEKLESSKIRGEMALWNREKAYKYYTVDTVIDKIFKNYRVLKG
ncbi:glycosyltransferase family 4 protein [Clostridium perfringens]|nr:glycosyltransferase family 4 protein [Clostridium perfringens]